METPDLSTREFGHGINSLNNQIDQITKSTQNFCRVFSSTISQAIVQGQGLEVTLESLKQRFLSLALRQAVAPLESAFSSIVGSIANGIANGILPPSAAAGPTGLPSLLGGQTAAPLAAPSVVFNVTAQDVSSFKKSEAQMSSLLARTVSNGQRLL